MNPRARHAASGAAAALVWGAQERLDTKLFRCEFSDIELLGRGSRARGYAIHAANGAIFGLAYYEVRKRKDVSALAFAMAEHLGTWPLMAIVDRKLAVSPRAFALEAWRHALLGTVLGLLTRTRER